MTSTATMGTVFGAAALLAIVPAWAGDSTPMIVVPDLAASHWQPAPPDLPSGMTITVLQGDPSKPGPFVLRVTMPADTVIMPHTHSKPETVTVLSGDVFHEHGTTLDKGKGTAMHAGGFVYLPEGHPHSLWTTGAPAVLQVSGSGPFGVDYINKSDAPNYKKS